MLLVIIIINIAVNQPALDSLFESSIHPLPPPPALVQPTQPSWTDRALALLFIGTKAYGRLRFVIRRARFGKPIK